MENHQVLQDFLCWMYYKDKR
jgi:Uncharacterized protein family UPF0029